MCMSSHPDHNTGEPTYQFPSVGYARQFTEIRYLHQHQLTHRACPYCSKYFPDPQLLDRYSLHCMIKSHQTVSKGHKALNPYLNSIPHLIAFVRHIEYHVQNQSMPKAGLNPDHKKAYDFIQRFYFRHSWTIQSWFHCVTFVLVSLCDFYELLLICSFIILFICILLSTFT